MPTEPLLSPSGNKCHSPGPVKAFESPAEKSALFQASPVVVWKDALRPQSFLGDLFRRIACKCPCTGCDWSEKGYLHSSRLLAVFTKEASSRQGAPGWAQQRRKVIWSTPFVHRISPAGCHLHLLLNSAQTISPILTPMPDSFPCILMLQNRLSLSRCNIAPSCPVEESLF